jgi:predicted CXXCH cytochrome family protein
MPSVNADLPTRVVPDTNSFSDTLPKQGGPQGYVTSVTCKECHQKQYETWWRSYHRQMTQIMDTNTVKAKFDGVKMDFGGERFTLHESTNHFWVDIQVIEEIDPSQRANGAPPAPVRVPMQMVTGSHYFQVFWLPSGQGNQQIGFPFTWLIEERRWVERNDAFIRDPNNEQLPEQWNMVCIRCHTTGGRPIPDAARQLFDTHVTELGIACEACHGPGEKHLALERQHQREGIESSHTASGIVQPAHLDHVRSSQVCGFCHSMKWFDEKEQWTQNGFRYRPGDDLEMTTPIIRPTKLAEQPWLGHVLAKHPDILSDFFWPDGMIRVTGREFNGLIESACYQKGDLGCVTCHSMHKSDPDKQLKEGMNGNQACLGCHQQYNDHLTEHTHHKPGSSGSLCYNCHMPHTSYGLLRAVRSHQIERPTVMSQLKTGRPNACNLCHLDKTLEWTGQRLSEWYSQPVPRLGEEDRKLSATVKLLLSGDAGQRALAAFSLGWKPAVAASGNNWEAPLLAYALDDSYAAVRSIAYRSLGHLPGFESFQYDFESDQEHQHQSRDNALALWRSVTDVLTENEQTLTGPGPVIKASKITELIEHRDNRPVHLRE